MTAEIVHPDDLEADESTPGIARRLVFETDNNVMVHSTVAADTVTGWHHHGDRDAYGYVLEGEGVVEFETPTGIERLDVRAPRFFHISAGTVHREITDAEMEVVVSFVGTGPVVENVEGPGTE